MTHLLSDPRVVEAATRAVRAKLPPGAQFGPSLNVLDAIAFSEIVLAAAVAALPREELVEKAARAAFADRWPDLEWDGVVSSTRATWRGNIAAGMEAIGLIPEHVTPKEKL